MTPHQASAASDTAETPTSISIVIVNWNGGDLLLQCLESLAATRTDSHPQEIIVVDNGSTDDSLSACERFDNVTVIENGVNLGFGAACNIGARVATSPLLLFLNPDCVVGPGSIDRCSEEFRDPGVGVCGIALTDENGAVSRSCHRFPTVGSFMRRILGLHVMSQRFDDGSMRDWNHAVDSDVDHVIGAFYMMRRDVFARLGGFDERFFVYLEDLDLSLRVRRSGLRVRFLAGPTSYHAGGGVSRQVKARRLFYATRSRILYAYKHFPAWQAHAHLAMTLFVEPLTRALLALVQRSVSGASETVAGFGMVWRDLPSTLRAASQP